MDSFLFFLDPLLSFIRWVGGLPPLTDGGASDGEPRIGPIPAQHRNVASAAKMLAGRFQSH